MPTAHEQKLKTVDDMLEAFRNKKKLRSSQERTARELEDESED